MALLRANRFRQRLRSARIRAHQMRGLLDAMEPLREEVAVLGTADAELELARRARIQMRALPSAHERGSAPIAPRCGPGRASRA